MGNVQRVLASVFCEAPGCPEDAAPDARFCTRHMRARIVRLDCSYWRCDNAAEDDSIFCEAHGLLEEARSQPPAQREELERAAVFAASAPQTKEPTVDAPFERPPCRIPDCPELAAPITIGARKQGGRYDLCQRHLDELAARVVETRRRNRAERLRESPLGSDRSDGGIPAPSVSTTPEEGTTEGAAGSPAVEGTEIAPPREDGAISLLREPTMRDLGIREEDEPAIPPARLCGRHSEHDAHDWIEDDDPSVGMESIYHCDGSGEGDEGGEPEPDEREARPGEALPPIQQEPQPGDVELFTLPHADYCALDTDHEGPCRDFDGRNSIERAEQHVSEINPAAARDVGPQRDPTWAERGEELARLGQAIDDAEHELDMYRARWRALASPE